MHRRQFMHTLNAMGAGIALPAWAFHGENAYATTPTSAVEVAGGDQAIPKIGVVAVGGQGCAILNDLAGRLPYLGLSFAIDTDVASLLRVKAERKVLVGDGNTLPLNSHAARRLAQSSFPEIADAVAGLDMVLLVTGMGGAAGSSIAPLVAQMLRGQDILTLAFAILPPGFESQPRQQNAQIGIHELGVHVNALVPFFHGDRVRTVAELASSASVSSSSQAALVFEQLWRGILKPVCQPGWINIDFEDLRHILLNHQGDCAFGFGSASGVDSATAAAFQALEHPLLGRSRLQRASGLLVTVRASRQVLQSAGRMAAIRSIRKQLSQDAWFLYGAYQDDTVDSKLMVSILATGIRET